jgi:hypothetical protein
MIKIGSLIGRSYECRLSFSKGRRGWGSRSQFSIGATRKSLYTLTLKPFKIDLIIGFEYSGYMWHAVV